MKFIVTPILYLLASCALFSPLFAFSTSVVDSLELELVTKTGSDKVLFLVDIAYEINVKDLPKAKAYVDQAMNLALELEDEMGIGTAHYAQGYLLHLEESYEEAKESYEAAIKIFEKIGADKKNGESHFRMGHIYSVWAEYERSQIYYAKALDLAKKEEDQRFIPVIIFSMANNYSYLGEYTKAFDLLEESKTLINHRPHLINYYAILGDLYKNVGENQNSLNAFFESKKICEEFTDTLRLAYVYKGIAETYMNLGDYEEAANSYFKIIDFNEQLRSPNLTIISLIGLGELYRLWDNPEKSLASYQKALMLAQKNQLNEMIPVCYIGMGETHKTQGAFQLGLHQFELGMEAAETWKLLDKRIEAQINIGEVYLAMKEPEKALKILFETLDLIASDWSEQGVLSDLYGAIGQAFLLQEKYNQSILYFEKGLKYAEANKHQKELGQYYFHLSQVYQKVNNYPLALKYQQEYSTIYEKQLQSENSQKLLNLRSQFEAEEKEKEILLLQKERELQAMTLYKQQVELTRKEAYLLGLTLLLFFGGLFFYLFFHRYKLKKKAEELDYKKRQIELEKEHLEISQQLEMAELRSHFFTDVSHEIRTPLTMILCPLEELLTKPSEGSAKATYQLIHRNAQRLLELVNQTLEFSKLENGHLPMQTERFHMGELCEGLIQGFFPLIKAKSQKITLINKAPHLYINCDLDKIQKAISNIITNAIEHTHVEGEISIILENSWPDKKIEVEEQPGAMTKGELWIHIQDNGKGISEEHMQFIFQRYYQVDKKSHKGTGIGLALAKKIIEMHQGDIEVRSREDQGSVFSIRVPMSFPLEASALPNENLWQAKISFSNLPVKASKENRAYDYLPESGEQRISDDKALVLIVEDHVDLRSFLAKQIEGLGYKVELADNGATALTMAEEIQPDLIISDVMMPEMDGMEFLNRLKEDPSINHIPFILLTAKASFEAKIQGLRSGADDYLTKPFQIEELLVRAKNLIEQRKKLQKTFSQNPFAFSGHAKINVRDEQFLKEALDLVSRKISDTQFNVSVFCHELGMSRTNVFKKIKALTGQNITGFIRTIRLKKAALLLKNNNGNMFEIATLTGFNTRQSFNKAFKNHFGMSPTEFKNKERGKPSLQQKQKTKKVSQKLNG